MTSTATARPAQSAHAPAPPPAAVAVMMRTVCSIAEYCCQRVLVCWMTACVCKVSQPSAPRQSPVLSYYLHCHQVLGNARLHVTMSDTVCQPAAIQMEHILLAMSHHCILQHENKPVVPWYSYVCTCGIMYDVRSMLEMLPSLSVPGLAVTTARFRQQLVYCAYSCICEAACDHT